MKRPVLAAETGVFGLAHPVERLAEMAHDVELVEQDRGLRRSRRGGVAERLPHVHHRQADAVALALAQPGVELRHAGLGPVLTAKPDRPLALQVADDDAVAVALADRDLIDADRLRSWLPGAGELDLHVLLLQRLDRLPVEPQLLGHVADRGLPTTPADIVGKALRVARVAGQEVQPLALHRPAAAALNPPHLQLQDDPKWPARQVANPPHSPVIPAPVRPAATAAQCFFERR